MDSVTPSPDSARPPILARLHDAPSAQGLTIPFVTLCHRGGRMPVWGALDPADLQLVLSFSLCQVCGHPFGDRVVVLLRPADWLRGIGPEPGLHPECAHYATAACPVLAARVSHYRSRATAARLTRCDDPQCQCAVWKPPVTGSDEDKRAGQPIEAWYAVWIDRDHYRIARHPGDEDTPPMAGVLLRDVPLLAIRKVRDATPDPGARSGERTVLDVLAAVIALDRYATGKGASPL
ncbi:hypothetical protein [Nocardia mexicana]|uniref:Uncharacterized protein n=1 Tax=Nocardia mexicana TaxID=279262 RepID=A0A370GNK5_9NOCA|nr:hypothetical protein [Nocardia mexicana]RDI45308.1 hypothetical protein DFR68_11378 [Nocardia mexicana]